jgi:hypothetical protein
MSQSNRCIELERMAAEFVRSADDKIQESRAQTALLEQATKRANQATQLAESLRAELSYGSFLVVT